MLASIKGSELPNIEINVSELEKIKTISFSLPFEIILCQFSGKLYVAKIINKSFYSDFNISEIDNELKILKLAKNLDGSNLVKIIFPEVMVKDKGKFIGYMYEVDSRNVYPLVEVWNEVDELIRKNIIEFYAEVINRQTTVGILIDPRLDSKNLSGISRNSIVVINDDGKLHILLHSLTATSDLNYAQIIRSRLIYLLNQELLLQH